jgi:hypothetical protein
MYLMKKGRHLTLPFHLLGEDNDQWRRNMPLQRLVPTREFLDMTNMNPTQFFLLYETAKLPIVRKNHNAFIDINDVRAARYLPNYQPAKNLFE